MSFKDCSEGYFFPRTLSHVDRLFAWKYGLYFSPVVVEINPNSTCNQRCRYCYVAGRTDGRLEDSRFISLMKELSVSGVKAVVFQGTGEPLMHKSFAEAVEVANDANLSLSVTTNGVLLNQAMQEKVLKHLTYIKFSSLESSPSRYAYNHGCVEKQWHILIDNIKSAVEYRKSNGLKTLFLSTVYITKENFSEAYQIVKFLKEIGLDYVSIQEAVYNNYSYVGAEKLTSDSFSLEQIKIMKDKILSLADESFFARVRFPINDTTFINGKFKDTWVNGWCQGIKFFTIINSDGEVYPCYRYWGIKEFSYGNIYEKSFEEIWRSERRKEIEEYTNITPPERDECSSCNATKTNSILWNLKHENKWRNFLV